MAGAEESVGEDVPFGVPRAGLRFRLVGERGAFVRLASAPSLRTYAGECTDDSGAVAAHLAWTVRADRAAIDESVATNGELDLRMARERRALADARSLHPALAAAVAAPAGARQGPPLWHCRRIDRWFHPVCGRTGGVLRTCRDDGVLAAAGLGSYAAARVRWQHDPAGGVEGPFYGVVRPADVAREANVVVGERALVESWTRLVQSPGEPTFRRAAAALPCCTCAHRAECHGAGADGDATAAQRELHAVSFGDVDAFVHPLDEWTAEEAAALLGGAAVAEFADERLAAVRTRAVGALEQPMQWLYGDDPAAFVLEALWQKLRAFRAVAEAVDAVHATGRPHLGVAAPNLRASLPGSAGGAPVRWQMLFRLSGLGAAAAVPLVGSECGEVSWQPAPELVQDARARPFVPTTLQKAGAQVVTMAVHVRTEPAAGGRCRLTVELHRAGVPGGHGIGDVVLVQPLAGGPAWALRIEANSGRGLVAGGEVDARAAPPGADVEARLTFVQAPGPTADLHSLGVWLLQLLFVTDDQDLEQVAEAAERCRSRFIEAVGAAPAVGDCGRAWLLAASGGAGGGRLHARHLLFAAAAREGLERLLAKGAQLVPAAIWDRVLLLLGGLLTGAPGVGWDRPDAARPLAGALAAAARIEALLRIELFGRERRDHALLRVCSAQIEDLEHELEAEPASQTTMPALAPAAGFVLRIERLGQAGGQDLRCTGDRVTIGRREGSSDVRLADPMVSAVHAVVERTDDGYVLYDCGSTNGTEVDGIRLPVEVPQPLEEGSVIHIRPFTLTFRTRAHGAATAVAPADAEDLLARLSTVYAESVEGARADVGAALRAVCEAARVDVGRSTLRARLEGVVQEILRRQPGHDPRVAERLRTAEYAMSRLAQLSRALLLDGELATTEQVSVFLGRLQRFVETTTAWMERLLDLRRTMGRHLDLSGTNAGKNDSALRESVRSASEVQQLELSWSGEAAARPAGEFVARFHEDLLLILEGLLRGNVQIRRAVREQLDPDRLAADAPQESKLALLARGVVDSQLWQRFVQVFREVTGPHEHEAEIERLIQIAAERRGRRRGPA
jgi:hypothetical protein